jgi:hypothetical protein
MPNTSKFDKKNPKKSKDEAETLVIPEKKGKKNKMPKEEAQRAEEEEPSSHKTERKEKRRNAAEGEGSALKLGSLAQGLKESRNRAKKSQKPDGTTLDRPKSASGPVKGKSEAETSKNTSGPSRSSKLVGAHEAHVPKQEKRSRDDDESVASTSTVAKKLKLNSGGAAAALSKVKEPSSIGGKYSSKGEEEITLEDSSDEDVEGEHHIHGFSTDGDSSDDDAMVAEVPALDVSRLPAIANDDVTVQRRLQRAKRKPVSNLTFDYYPAYPCSYRQWTMVYFT